MNLLFFAWSFLAATVSPLLAEPAQDAVSDNTRPMAMKAADRIGEAQKPAQTAATSTPTSQPQAAAKAAAAGATYMPTAESRGRELNLSPEQEAKLRELVKRQKMSDAQKAREKQMLDRTPVMNKTYNPNIKEDQSIPKRF